MFFSKKCPKCGNTEIAGPHGLAVEHVFSGQRIIIDLPGGSEARLLSYSCSKCGFTEFYADKTGRANLMRKGIFSLNPQPKRLERCPSCKTPTREGYTTCHACGADIMKI